MQDANTLLSRPGTVASAVNWWTASYESSTPDVLRCARRTAGAILVGVVGFALATVILLASGQTTIALPLFLAMLALLLCGVALRAGVSIPFVVNANIAVNFAVLFGMVLATGGESVGFLIATPVVPALAVLIGNRRSVLFWSGMAIATIAVVVVLTWLEFTFPIQPDLSRVAIAKLFAAIVVIGMIFGISRLFLDDRDCAEQALLESERLFNQAARTAKLGYWSFDNTSGQYQSVSEEYARIFGFTVDEFLKRHRSLEQDLELVHPEDRAMVAERYELCNGRNIEYRIVRADGSVRTVLEIERLAPDTAGGRAMYHGTLQDITEIRRVEARTRELQNAQYDLTKNLADARRAEQLVKLGTYEWDCIENRLVACSEEYARIHEMSTDEVLQTFTSDAAYYNYIHPGDREGIAKLDTEAGIKREGYSAAYQLLLPSGNIRHVRGVCEVELNDQGEVVRTLGSLQDVSEQFELEERLRQAQKMEAIGTLAGGIAHDFNNLLTVINGHSHLILDGLKPDDPFHLGLSEIAKASDHAATLTRQLLAFSSKQVMQPKVINLGEIVVEIESMLRRLIGEHIDLHVRSDLDLRMVKVDPGQINQVIMNLIINARDAMPRGGNITVSIENVSLDDESSAALGDLPAGDYVMLLISDTGVGMDEETLIHIFEPFFTTKGTENGTGLGLSTVFGIVKQSGGGIEAVSDPGTGTTFRIYLPQVEITEPIIEEKERFVSPLGGCQTIMVVEDEDMIRELLKRILERIGFTVLIACQGDEALLIAEQHEGPIDLIITDVVMPKMSGYELVERISPRRPEMAVLYMSGHDEKMVADQGRVGPGRQILQKPFRPKDVAGKICEILNKEMNPAPKPDQTAVVRNEFEDANTLFR